MMLLTLCLGGKVQQGGRELLEQWRTQDESWLWIDLQDEDPAAEKTFLCNELGLDAFAVAEAQRRRHPPGFSSQPDYIYLLAKPLTSDSEDLDFSTLQLAIFAAPRLLVTRHSEHSRFISILHKRLMSEGCKGESPISLTAAIARRITERYGQILLNLEARLDEIEDLLFEKRGDELMRELVAYNTALRKMRRILAYHTNAFELMRNHFDPANPAHTHEEFNDIHSQMQRFYSLAEMYQNVINDLIEGYISLNAHHLNQIMKVLTIVTVIFVPLTLLVGVYGMNFEYIPELKSRYGYFILLSVMFLIASGLLYLFRRVRWL
jgi:magnesium transporter